MEAGVERNHRMELQYDGTGLHGWAKQNGLSTVEGCLETAFCTVLGFVPLLRVAGRTDAGVHARRQVVSLSLPSGVDLPKLLASLNALTPPGVAVTRLGRAPERFDARKDATSRTYRYFISTETVVSPFWRRYCWQVPRTVDVSALHSAAAATEGRHDFTAFTPTETEHVFFGRLVLRCAWKRATGGFTQVTRSHQGGGLDGEGAGRSAGGRGTGGCGAMLYLEIEAEAFLRHMVRSLVGTMIEVADGTRGMDSYRRLLEGAARGSAGPTAPARGLFLWDVRYGSGPQATPSTIPATQGPAVT